MRDLSPRVYLKVLGLCKKKLYICGEKLAAVTDEEVFFAENERRKKNGSKIWKYNFGLIFYLLNNNAHQKYVAFCV